MSTRTLSDHRGIRFVCALLVALTTTSLAHGADDDPMAPYRERFKAGMERYKADDFRAAIDVWEGIYRDVGPDKGYRVAFDLARAYDKAGDQARAAERYTAFLRVIDARRASGAPLEAVVLAEETEARARIAQLPAVPEAQPASSPVAPTPPPPVEPAPPPPAPPAVVAPPAAPLPAPVRAEQRTERPFPGAILFVAGGATIAAGAIGAVEYALALSTQSSFNAAAGNVQAQLGYQGTYDGMRSIAYGALGTSIGLAAVTAGLSAWYFAGSKTHEVTIAPVVSAAPGGAQAGAIVRF